MNNNLNNKNLIINDSDYFAKDYSYTKRPIMQLIACNKLNKIDAAAIFSVSIDYLRQTMLNKSDFIRILFGGLPTLFGICSTEHGRLGSIAIPVFNNELYSKNEEVIEHIHYSIELAKFYGAKSVSLTGLLPSATNYGARIIESIPNDKKEEYPTITTGHAVTISAVILQLYNLLSKTDKDIKNESICIVGLGSIGSGILELLINSIGHPKSLTLCDLFRNKSDIDQLKILLENKYQYKGSLKIISNDRETNKEIYKHSIILSATNDSNVINISDVQEGTIIIDDSAPHCFNVDDAMKRILSTGDILAVEAGLVSLPNAAKRLLWNPFHVSEAVLKPSELEPRTIMGCEYSALLTSKINTLLPTIGKVDSQVCLDTYNIVSSIGITNGPVRLETFAYSDNYIDNFANIVTQAA